MNMSQTFINANWEGNFFFSKDIYQSPQEIEKNIYIHIYKCITSDISKNVYSSIILHKEKNNNLCHLKKMFLETKK